jgi:hypothetical protein
MGGGMKSKIMGSQIHTCQLARLFDHHLGGIVSGNFQRFEEGDIQNFSIGQNFLYLSVCNQKKRMVFD